VLNWEGDEQPDSTVRFAVCPYWLQELEANRHFMNIFAHLFSISIPFSVSLLLQQDLIFQCTNNKRISSSTVILQGCHSGVGEDLIFMVYDFVQTGI